MYDLISDIISHTYIPGSDDQLFIYSIAGALIVIFSVVFIDLAYRVFSHFWNGGR